MTEQSTAPKVKSPAGQRYNLLDIIRALAVISMVLYHAAWDAFYIFGADMPWFRSQGAFVWQQCTCITFLTLSGFCISLGRKMVSRALTVLGCSLVIRIVTVIFMPSSAVRFGVLCLLGSAMLLIGCLDRWLKRVNPYLGTGLCFLLFALTRYVKDGVLGFFGIELVKLPRVLYTLGHIGSYLGFKSEGFFSTDYFPIIPWIFVCLFGYYLHKIFAERRLMEHLKVRPLPALEFVGRHALWFYMAHQAVVYAVMYLIFEIIL